MFVVESALDPPGPIPNPVVPQRSAGEYCTGDRVGGEATADISPPLRHWGLGSVSHAGVQASYRGVEQWQLVGLITQRSGVRIPPPQPRWPGRERRVVFFTVSTTAPGSLPGGGPRFSRDRRIAPWFLRSGRASKRGRGVADVRPVAQLVGRRLKEGDDPTREGRASRLTAREGPVVTGSPSRVRRVVVTWGTLVGPRLHEERRLGSEHARRSRPSSPCHPSLSTAIHMSVPRGDLHATNGS
jgi:hypothetical protein